MYVTRRALPGTLLAVVLAGVPLASHASSSPSSRTPTTSSNGPALRAGPLGPNPVSIDVDAPQRPVAIRIPAVAIDAAVEQNRIVDGTMLDPSGPWVVSWYRETAQLGEGNNTVMAGHLDYWDTGPAVFFDLPVLNEGDEIHVEGASGDVFTYEVAWVRLYLLEELTSQTIAEIVGTTPVASLTLITCGGEFDEASGQYLSRYVVRAELASST